MTNTDHVECEVCGCGTHLHETKAEAVAAWNRRAAPPVTDETIERIAKAIFLAEHPDAEWSAGRARAVWFTRAEAALQVRT